MRISRSVVSALGLCAALLASSAMAQQANDQQGQEQKRADVSQLDQKTSGPNVRVSQLMGANIQNSRGENVGEIEDIVLDATSGKVRYAAVTYGGFLGLGDKLFAVPFQAFKVQRQSADSNEYTLVLNVTQEQLEGAQGFNEDNWPNFADREFTREVDRRYGINQGENVRREVERQREADVDVDVDAE